MQFPYCYIVAPFPLSARKMKRGGDPFLTIAKFIKLKKQNNRKPGKKNGDPRPRSEMSILEGPNLIEEAQ